MTTRVIVNGAYGKMGRMACDTLREQPSFELVAALGRDDNLQEALSKTKPHIVIELTRADCVYANSLAIIHHQARPVIGASGLLPNQIVTLQHLCAEKKLGGIIAPNFSIAAVLMMRFAAMAARFLPDVEIIEAHHPEKWDAPSGTAIKTANMIAAARAHKKNAAQPSALSEGSRGALHDGIPIHAIRLPGILANQQVLFGSKGETLSITHNSIDRSAFMPGILLACQRVLHLQQLYYGLEHLLDEPETPSLPNRS